MKLDIHGTAGGIIQEIRQTETNGRMETETDKQRVGKNNYQDWTVRLDSEKEFFC